MKFVSLLPLLFAAPALVLGATITVTTTSDALSDTGSCSLREAVIAANNNAPSGATAGECPSGSSGSTDTIVLPAGTFNLTLAGTESGSAVIESVGDLDVIQSVNLVGQGPASTTVNAASLGARILHIDSPTAVVALTGLRLRDGFSDSYGGGIYLEHGTALSLSNVEITSCDATYQGGGISVTDDADLTLLNSTISNNTSGAEGGGVDFASLGVLSLTRSSISGNQANGSYSDGGGIHAWGTTVLAESVVSNNTTGASGGGLHIGGGLSATKSTLSGNQAADDGGGAYFYWGGAIAIDNCTFSGNHAGRYGGGLGNYNSDSATLTHVTIANNTASSSGSALDPDTDTVLRNTIVSGTCRTTVVTSQGGNIESPGDNCGLDSPSDQVAVSAQQLSLGALANNGGPTQTHLPGGTSWALNTASATYCLSDDQRGLARPQGTGCDVGAVEYSMIAGLIFSDGFESGGFGAWD